MDLGYMEIVLTGIHLSSYGEDLSEKEPLLGLMARLDVVGINEYYGWVLKDFGTPREILDPL